MNFNAIDEKMGEGFCVRRFSWPDGMYGYKTLLKINGTVEYRLTTPAESAGTWEPTTEDRKAIDWEIIPGLIPSHEPKPEPFRLIKGGKS